MTWSNCAWTAASPDEISDVSASSASADVRATAWELVVDFVSNSDGLSALTSSNIELENMHGDAAALHWDGTLEKMPKTLDPVSNVTTCGTGGEPTISSMKYCVSCLLMIGRLSTSSCKQTKRGFCFRPMPKEKDVANPMTVGAGALSAGAQSQPARFPSNARSLSSTWDA